MWAVSVAIARKDMTLLLTRGNGLAQAILLGLLLIFVFSLAQGAGETLSPQGAATVFWMSSLFCQILLFNQLFALEEVNQSRIGLILLPGPVYGVWIAKTLAGLMLLIAGQLCFFPSVLVFLGQKVAGNPVHGLLGLLGCDIGICALGSLLGALSEGQTTRESLLSILLFPLITPLLLAAISIHTATLGGEGQDVVHWLSLVAAYDAIFCAVSCFLFSFLYTGDDA